MTVTKPSTATSTPVKSHPSSNSVRVSAQTHTRVPTGDSGETWESQYRKSGFTKVLGILPQSTTPHPTGLVVYVTENPPLVEYCPLGLIFMCIQWTDHSRRVLLPVPHTPKTGRVPTPVP